MENPNDPTLRNAIHAADGARQYGYQAALVGGVTVYGWCVPTILEAAGEAWLDSGWAEVHFRRPTYPGDEMSVRANLEGETWSLSADKAGGETCVRGQFGLGEAPWLGLLERSSRLAGDPEPAEREWLTLENAPIGKDLLTLPLNISADEARQTATKQLRETNPLFIGDRPLIHPSTIARQMMTLLAYSLDYGRPSIHVSTHIQHLARVESGQFLLLTGHFVSAYEQKGHHYAIFDGTLINGAGTELARIRHTNIFKVAKRESA
ncbi:MAG: hypothetical protein C0506_09190 [Anaerolinea sp.]|nr:hypothetical protein [Anaerolinea sp.]